MPHPISEARPVQPGFELKVARVQRGLKQLEVAEAIAVHQTTISLAERGLRWPTDEVIDRLARFYGTTFEQVCRWLRNSRLAAAAEDSRSRPSPPPTPPVLEASP